MVWAFNISGLVPILTPNSTHLLYGKGFIHNEHDLESAVWGIWDCAIPTKHFAPQFWVWHVSRRSFGAGEIVGYYWYTLVYSDLATEEQSRESYGYAILFLTVKDFSGWGCRRSETFPDRQGIKNETWIVSDHFFSMQFLSYHRYLPGVRCTYVKKNTASRDNNDCLVQIYFPVSAFEVRNFHMISAKPIANEKQGEEHFCRLGLRLYVSVF